MRVRLAARGSRLAARNRLSCTQFLRTWRVRRAFEEQRGEMVASFLSQNDPTSISANAVKQLLGPPIGYYDYDENVAYVVGPKSVESAYGKGYLLAFVADKASGKMSSVIIVPTPRSK